MKRSIKDKDFINISSRLTRTISTKWTDQTLNWFIQMAICYRITNRKDGGPLDWLMASINIWLPKHLATSSTQMEPVWRKNKCGHWNHQTPAKVSNVFFSRNKFTRIIKKLLNRKIACNETWVMISASWSNYSVKSVYKCISDNENKWKPLLWHFRMRRKKFILTAINL